MVGDLTQMKRLSSAFVESPRTIDWRTTTTKASNSGRFTVLLSRRATVAARLIAVLRSPRAYQPADMPSRIPATMGPPTIFALVRKAAISVSAMYLDYTRVQPLRFVYG